ncbi:MAG: hypothetical protein ACOX4N_00465 [Dethiobacteraceae bacterium]
MLNTTSFHTSLESLAEDKDTPVRVLAAKDGYYEVRQNDIGVFCARTNFIEMLDACKEKFIFTLPPIPFSILLQTISFFKAHSTHEAVVNIYFDKDKEQYFAEAPPQKVSNIHFEAERPLKEPHIILVMEIHSHHKMPAKFSSIDNEEQKETILFAVVGSIDKFFPDITVRASCAGKYIPVDPGDVFESPNASLTDWIPNSYPSCWDESITVTKVGNNKKHMEGKARCSILGRHTYGDNRRFF